MVSSWTQLGSGALYIRKNLVSGWGLFLERNGLPEIVDEPVKHLLLVLPLQDLQKLLNPPLVPHLIPICFLELFL